MIGVNRETPAIQEVSEMPDGQEDTKEFTVESRVVPFRLSELATEKGQWLPYGANFLLEDCSQCSVRCVTCERSRRSLYRMMEHGCVG